MKKWLKFKLIKKQPKNAVGVGKTNSEDTVTKSETPGYYGTDTTKFSGRGKSMNICDLPDELILHIFRYLSPVERSFTNLCQTCRRFLDLSDQDCLYTGRTSFKIGPDDIFSSTKLVRLMRLSANCIQKVNLSDCSDVSDEVIFNVVISCPVIKSLNLAGCGQVSNNSLRIISQNLKLLESLNISECPWVTISGIFLLVTNVGKTIRKLRMDNCLGLLSNGLQTFSLGKYCPKLTHYSLAWSADFGFQQQKISVNMAKFTSKCHRLVHLNISHNKCEDNDLTVIAAHCPRLKHLTAHHLFQDSNLTGSGLGLIHLSTLDITDSWDLTDNGLSKLIESCRLLSTLILTRCYGLRGQSIVLTISSCENLRRLYVDYCFYVDHKALEWVATMSKNLVYMNVSYNVNIATVHVLKIKRVRAAYGRIPVHLVTHGCPRVMRNLSRFHLDKDVVAKL